VSARSLLEERVVGEVHRLCYAGLDAETLHRRTVGCLRRAIPFEGYCAHDADPVSGLLMRIQMDPPDEQRGRFFLEHVYFEDRINDFDWMVRTRRPVALLSAATGGQLDRSLRYRESIAPRGFRFDLRSVFTSGQEHWAGLTLWREPGRPDFTDHEVALLGRLAPHLGAGFKGAGLRTQAAVPAPAADGAPGVLTLDGRGRVVQYTASAERWLRELVDLGPGWQDGRGLPDAVWLVAGALRHALHAPTEGNLARVPRVCVHARSGRWVQLQAALTEGQADRAGETVVVIAAMGPTELSWLRTSCYGLTAREQQVVELVLRGASTREIATALVISEYTVQDHLSHIFDKVDVRSRRALIKRLYLDSFDASPA
jgi:DNA-binding CsgD family transcriptional regulator